ncbi:TIGR00730 family Rossman fold protein [Candidatus Deferrimicrobium sp.]|uniref:LOG family protein n=1 Tax=Candidatus Deferrimicrobium sp. TaxID=3060586 RepID=UPI002ED18521
MTKVRGGGRNSRVTVEELIVEMHRTVDGLGEDGASRADLKLLSRTLKELRHAFRFFDGLRTLPKVTVFGSARLPADSPAYRQAELFGRAMARSGWFVVTGAGEGIMEAAHVGAGREHSIGVNILLPFEQSENTVMERNPHLIHTKYFFTRKLLFLKESSGVVLFPGGFGTMDEAFEVLTLLQTGKTHPFPVVLVDEPGGTYWAMWRRFLEDSLLKFGLISPEDFSLFRITSSVEEAVREIRGYYRVFHSMRYSGRDLVIRIREPLAPDALAALNRDFPDLLVEGTISQVNALPEEADEPEIADLPRIVFRFNSGSHGRLRQLIDRLNRSEGEDP